MQTGNVQDRDTAVIVYCTFPTLAEAEGAARLVVEQRLAACANIVTGLVSLYIWQDKLQRDQEVAMIMKTRASLADAAIALARERHPYENPAFVVVPVVGGAPPFLAWIMAQTRAISQS